MAQPILFGGDLTTKNVLPQFYKEYINGNDLAPFMGGSEMPIHVKDVEYGSGEISYFSMLDALNPDLASIDMEQAKGTGQRQVIHPDEVRVRQIRQVAGLDGPRIMKLRTPIDVFGALKSQLMDAVQQRYRNDLFDASKYAYVNADGTAPSKHRSLFGNGTAVDPNAGWNTNITTALTALGDADGMSVKHILRLRDMAVNGGVFTEANRAKKIRPAKLLMKDGVKEEQFILLMTPRAFAILAKDPDYKSFGPARGVIESSMQPSMISGSRFRGMLNGVLLYEMPELERNTYTGAGDSNRDVVHSIFLGAQAWGCCHAGISEIAYEEDDFGNTREICHIIQRGVKMLQFADPNNGNAKIENGMIHSFTSASTNAV